MLETPQIVQTSAQPYAYVHLTVPRARIREVMGPGLAEVGAALTTQGVAATGPWFTHHLKVSPDIFDFEICMPVAAPIVAAGRVLPGQWPAMTVARTVYVGPYEGLGDAWGEFDAWIAKHRHRPAPDIWERYVVGPESASDAARWRTELTRPVTD